ncbi:hypothetical protein JQ310_20515, partial [Leptospira interrogans]|nr:hypothetical protein [Leptospira interrogans]
PLMLVSSIIILIRVLTLDNIDIGLGKMWNPDWSALLYEVTLARAGSACFRRVSSVKSYRLTSF